MVRVALTCDCERKQAFYKNHVAECVIKNKSSLALTGLRKFYR